jgi:ABC-2 type transport system ATP-binding protein
LRRGETVVSGAVRDLLRAEVRRVEVTLGDVSTALRERLIADGFSVQDSAGHVVVEIEGDDKVPKVLAAALEASARVVEVAPRRETLEDLFMRRAIG